MKICVGVGCKTGTSWLEFGGDLCTDMDAGILKRNFNHLQDKTMQTNFADISRN